MQNYYRSRDKTNCKHKTLSFHAYFKLLDNTLDRVKQPLMSFYSTIYFSVCVNFNCSSYQFLIKHKLLLSICVFTSSLSKKIVKFKFWWNNEDYIDYIAFMLYVFIHWLLLTNFLIKLLPLVVTFNTFKDTFKY